MKSSLILILFIASLFTIKTANAQFVGTGSQTDFITVNEIQKKAFWFDCTDRLIKVQGFIVEQIGKHYYWFEDTSGRMRMEIKPNHMPEASFDQNTEVVIYGKIDHYLFGRSEIEVSRVDFIKQHLFPLN
jgi:uncharacterized protein (TIGR00156 family)